MFNVYEYCVSEGWAKLIVRDGRGFFKKEQGRYVTVTKAAKIETYWR